MADVVGRLQIQVAAQTSQFLTGLKSAQSQFSKFTTQITSMAQTLGVAFGIQQVAAFGFEVSKLAGEFVGVKAAFDKLKESEKLMIDLKKATGDTVSELNLMKRSVQAANFGIALESLPELLRFASIRAQQTGQSVDYLVDSIITGIGRKSPLILDNLGISAVRLKEKFNGASLEAQSIGDVALAVGKIASEELKKMGDFSVNASSELQKLGASFDNLKVAIGGTTNDAGLFGDAIKTLNSTIVAFTDFLNGPGGTAVGKYIKLVSVVPRTTLNAINSVLGAFKDTTVDEDIETFNGLFAQQRFESAEAARQNELFSSGIDVIAQKAKLAGKELVILNDATGKYQLYLRNATVTNIEAVKPLEQLTEKLIQHKTGLEAVREERDRLIKQFSVTDLNDQKKINSLSQEILATNALISSIERLIKTRDESAILSADPSAAKFTGKDFLDQTGGVKIDESLANFENKNAQTTEKVKGQWVDLSGSISNSLSDISFALGQSIAGVGNFGDTIIRAVIGFAKQLGEILIATGVGMLAAKKLITNPYGAIAAGAIILALAGAASASLSRSQQNFNAGGGGGQNPVGRQAQEFNGARNNELRIDLTGKFRVDGRDLVLTLDNNNLFKSRMG